MPAWLGTPPTGYSLNMPESMRYPFDSRKYEIRGELGVNMRFR